MKKTLKPASQVIVQLSTKNAVQPLKTVAPPRRGAERRRSSGASPTPIVATTPAKSVQAAALAAVRERTEELAREHMQGQRETALQLQLYQPSTVVRPLAPVHAGNLRHTGLRQFLKRVLSEQEVHALLIQLRSTPNEQPRHAGELLRQAADGISFWCVLSRTRAEVLYVATVVAGIGRLLAPTLLGTSRVDDVLFSIVRQALYALEEAAPSEAALLRHCLGWGNVDEIDEQFIPGLRRAIARALDYALDGTVTKIFVQ